METVLITGTSRGIGLELAKQFLASGNKVIATYRGQMSDEIKELAANTNLTACELEVTDEKAISKLAETLSDITLDILVNNAGIIGPENQNLTDMNMEGWLNTFAVNTVAPLLISRAFIKNLKRSKNPRIITVSSMMGSLHGEGTGMYAYRSSKAAVNKVMRGLSFDLHEDGIIVCPIHPGWVKTDMGGSGAQLTAQESAAGIITLVSKLKMKESGKFFTWEGEEHKW